jgi:hypothetical protein
MSKADYQAIPALNAGGAHLIESRCAAKYWHTSPFNPDHANGDTANHFDIGSALHCLVLEPERFDQQVSVLDFKDYKTNAAKAAKAAAYADGKSPILTKELPEIEAMAAALLADPIASGFRAAGDPEVVMLYEEPDYGIKCKLRIDWLPHGDIIDLRDIKTAASAKPEDFERAAWNCGYPQRAAWYIDGVEAATGKRPRNYWFIAVEKEPPYLVSTMRYSDEDIEWGRCLNLAAKRRFVQCMNSGIWTSYSDRATEIHIPRWAKFQLQDEAEAGMIPTPRTLAEVQRENLVRFRAAARLQAPDMDRDFFPQEQS